MSRNYVFAGVALVIAVALGAWITTHRNSGTDGAAKVAAHTDANGEAGSASQAPYEGETNFENFQDNPALAKSLTEAYRGHFTVEQERNEAEWIQETREDFAKLDAMKLKEIRIEPELGVTTPAVFYTLTNTDGSTTADEARELPTHLPFAMQITFENNRELRVKTESNEQPSPETTKSFANTLSAIVNREMAKTNTGPLSTGP